MLTSRGHAVAEQLAVTSKPDLKFHDNAVFLAGKFGWHEDDFIKDAVRSEGGSITNVISEKVGVVIVGAESKGTPAAVKDAEKQNKKGARITIIQEKDFFGFCLPDSEEVIRKSPCKRASRRARTARH
jgi:NAD-dependent DNA ligase